MDISDIETPCYVINERKFNENCLEFERAFKKAWGSNVILAYSVKTNHHEYLLGLAKQRKWYAEVVSEKEYDLAIKNGFDKKNIIFNGPVKGGALDRAIRTEAVINLDHLDEIYHFIEKKQDIVCNVGIRVNFDLEKRCQGETTAGEHPSRFGICYENGDLEKAIKLLENNNIKLAALHMHTSTNTRSRKVFYEISKVVCEFKQKFGLDLKYIDIGGGFFGGKMSKDYPSVSEYADVICDTLKQDFTYDKTALILEPGASVAATAVDYYTKVHSVKRVRTEDIVTVDGSSLHINPFMAKKKLNYEIVGKTWEIRPVQQICGSTCMENDRMLLLKNQGGINEDNYIVIHDAGAYTMCLNNSFIHNPPKIYVKTENEMKEWGK